MKQLLTAFSLLALFAAPGFAQDFAPNPNGAPGSFDTGYLRVPVSITQSNDTSTITSLNSVACPADNDSYLRRFDLDGEFGIVSPYTIESVDVGIETSTGATIDVNLYTIPSGDAFEFANMTLIGSTTTAVTAPDGTIQNVAVTGTVADPVGTDLVVEVFAGDTAGGFTFFIGSNANGQTAPSFLASAGCGAPEPTDTAVLGFPGMHIVMVVNGDAGPAPNPFDIPTLDTLGLAGLVGLLALLGLVVLRRRA